MAYASFWINISMNLKPFEGLLSLFLNPGTLKLMTGLLLTSGNGTGTSASPSAKILFGLEKWKYISLYLARTHSEMQFGAEEISLVHEIAIYVEKKLLLQSLQLLFN